MPHALMQRIGRWGNRALVASVVAALGATLVVAGAAKSEAAAGTSRLYAGETLTANQSITSPNGTMNLVMQGDGNLVLYAPGSIARWYTHTDGNPGAYAVMQGDGNLVVYSAANVALWQAQTYDKNAAFAQVQDDGNLVVYTAAGAALWQTGTHYYPARLDTGSSLAVGQRLQSPNGAFEAVMQGDGNFVLFGPTGATWQSGTSGSGATWLAVQGDGNMVLYTATNAWKWQTYTDGRGAGFLQVQDDGNMVLYTSSGQWTWQTHTYPGAQPPAAGATKGQLAVGYATAQLGKPYSWGAAGPNAFDCSGLTQQSWAAAGVSIARVAADQYATLPKVPYDQRQPGDILAWGTNASSAGTVYHVAIYVGGGNMIEAPNAHYAVRLVPVRTYELMPYVLRPAS